MEVEELFAHLECNRGERVQEVKQLIYDQFAEVKEPWLINGLYDYYVSSDGTSYSRHPCLELILSVRDPHDKFLVDRLSEILLKGNENSKRKALHVFGQLIRKCPSWLHKITTNSMPLFRDLLRLLRNESEEVPILLAALLNLICLLPAIPSYITPYLNELFEIFSHLASWKQIRASSLNQLHHLHLQSILLSYFHRLYGMFPCNFLHYLRTTYANQSSLFKSSILPMLVTARLHPRLVSHSRDQEKSNSRWKKMELHDVLSESSRYALIPQEFNNEDVLEESYSLLLPEPLTSTVPSTAMPLDESWAGPSENTETAIEATPEATPFVTPSKEESMFRFNRSNSNVARSLRLDLSSVRSPVSFITSPTSGAGSKSIPLFPTSPIIGGPWIPPSPSGGDELKRRDSLFDKLPGDSASLAMLNKINQERKISPMKFIPPGDNFDQKNETLFSLNNVAMSGSNLENVEYEGLEAKESLNVSSPKDSDTFSKNANDKVQGFDESLNDSLPSCPSSSFLDDGPQQGRSRYISFCDEKVGILGLGSCTNDFGPSLNEKRRKRYYSCPDPSKLTQMNQTSNYNIHRSSSCRTSGGEDDVTLVREDVEASTQTELDGMSFAYEVLFPVEGLLEHAHLEKREVENPHLLLDKYLESVCNSAVKEQSTEEDYKSIITSLKSQLLYERNRREILGERNRRLLGKSKSSRILKEENTALRDQLQLVKSEIDDLHRQMEGIRREKHLVEEERSSTARNRDHEIEKRSAEIRSLKISAQKSEEIIEELNQVIEEGRKDLDASKAQFFLAKAECEVLQQKESERMMTEMELVRLRKELLMMGELQRKYIERLDHPGHNMESETMSLFKQAYERDLQTMSRALENKTFEVETYKSRIEELESHLTKKEAQIMDHKKLIKRIQDEHDEVLRESKSTYESMVQLHLQTESHILELRDQLAKNTRILNNNPASVANSSSLHAKKTHRPTGGLLDFHATRNVDIEQPEQTYSPADRSFVVGSPPLSSGGSLGSDKSEVMRRALESTRPIKFEEGEASSTGGIRAPPSPLRSTTTIIAKDSFESSLNGNMSS